MYTFTRPGDPRPVRLMSAAYERGSRQVSLVPAAYRCARALVESTPNNRLTSSAHSGTTACACPTTSITISTPLVAFELREHRRRPAIVRSFRSFR